MEAWNSKFPWRSYLRSGGVRTRVQSQHAQPFLFTRYTAKTIRRFAKPMLFVTGDISLEKLERLSPQMRPMFKFQP